MDARAARQTKLANSLIEAPGNCRRPSALATAGQQPADYLDWCPSSAPGLSAPIVPRTFRLGIVESFRRTVKAAVRPVCALNFKKKAEIVLTLRGRLMYNTAAVRVSYPCYRSTRLHCGLAAVCAKCVWLLGKKGRWWLRGLLTPGFKPLLHWNLHYIFSSKEY
jgi:hypothetical protein